MERAPTKRSFSIVNSVMNVKGLVGAFNQVSSTFKCYIYKNLYEMMCMYGAAGGEGGSIHTTNHLSLTLPCKLGHSPLTFD